MKRLFHLLALSLLCPGFGSAAEADVLKHPVFAPPVGVQAQANLGASLAAEGNLVVAGAPEDDTLAENSGVVKILDAQSGQLTQTLTNPMPIAHGLFGRLVVISGNRVVASAGLPGLDNQSSWRLHVYDLASTAPATPILSLRDNASSWTASVSSVAISGNHVAVVVFSRQGINLSDPQTRVLVFDLSRAIPNDPVATMVFPAGIRVAMAGTRLLVGDAFDDADGVDSGCVHVYDLQNGTPAFVTRIANPSPVAEDFFGGEIAISGNRAAITSYRDDTAGSNAGAVYVFDLGAATPGMPAATLLNPEPGGERYFGPVAIAGARVIVGSSIDGINSGSAFVFDLNSATPAVPVATLRNPTPDDADQFGKSVAVGGDFVSVASPHDDVGAAVNSGSMIFPREIRSRLREPSTSPGRRRKTTSERPRLFLAPSW